MLTFDENFEKNSEYFLKCVLGLSLPPKLLVGGGWWVELVVLRGFLPGSKLEIKPLV